MELNARSEVEEITENQQVFGALLTLHGFVHLFGAVISWRLFEVYNFHYEDVWPAAGTWPGRGVGIVWLAAAALLSITGVRLAANRPVRSAQLVASAGLSVAVTLTAFPSAIPGTVVSAGVLAAVAILALRRSSPGQP
jgi:hypothetical protein